MSTGVVWFRRDLRLEDNPAVAEASRLHSQVVGLFIIDPALWDRAHPRRRAQLSANLRELSKSIGGRLEIRHGPARAQLAGAVRDHGVERVYLNSEVTPWGQDRDRVIEGSVTEYWGNYLHPPDRPYLVFTPFYRDWLGRQREAVLEPVDVTWSRPLSDQIPDEGPPPVEAGERKAQQRLANWAKQVSSYPSVHDRPDIDGTSHLSVDLKWGTISPRQVIEAVGSGAGAQSFIRQLAWREFWAQLLWHHPETVDKPLKPGYGGVEWRNDPDEFEAWKAGQTGYPLVDAGMRQLAATGWIHNRVRMVVASFLVKDLLIDWRWGERYFRHQLNDGDTAQNVGNWQWVAGCGADAAPYFRIFNPVLQSQKFDPQGDYIRRWVSELSRLDGSQIHAPWELGPLELSAAAIELGSDYPNPIVDHAEARLQALATYKRALSPLR